MSTSLNIHPELRSIKGRTLPLNRFAVAAAQTLLSAVNALHRRKFKTMFVAKEIPSADGFGARALIIRPESLPPRAPALVYYHGGGFVMKPAPQHFENALRYAREANCLVIFTEYRLAPKHPFPAGFNDCYAALRWTLSNAETLGIDQDRVAVGGDSAGGGLAAGVVQRAVNEDGATLRAQLLIYPAVDLDCNRPSMSAYTNVPPFKNHSILDVARTYLGRPLYAGMPRYASPIDTDIRHLPPAYIETAEFDPLRDQGNAYAQRLTAKGVDVELNQVKGAIHGFDLLAANSSIAKEAMQKRIGFLRRVLMDYAAAQDEARVGSKG